METGELNFCHVFCSCLFIAASSFQLKKCAKCWDKFPINICVQKCRVSWGYRMATFIAETGATRFKECRQFISARLPLHHCVLSIVPKLGVVPSQRCGVRLKLPPFRGYFWCGFAKAFALSPSRLESSPLVRIVLWLLLKTRARASERRATLWAQKKFRNFHSFPLSATPEMREKLAKA